MKAQSLRRYFLLISFLGLSACPFSFNVSDAFIFIVKYERDSTFYFLLLPYSGIMDKNKNNFAKTGDKKEVNRGLTPRP
jgi:hypothetical protein